MGPESNTTGVFIKKKGNVATDAHTGERHVRAGGMVPQVKGLPDARGRAVTGPLPRAFGEQANGPPTPRSWTSGLQDYEAKRSCWLSLSVCGTSSQQL